MRDFNNNIPGVDPLIVQQVKNQTSRSAVAGSRPVQVSPDPKKQKERRWQRREVERAARRLSGVAAALEKAVTFQVVEREGQLLIQVLDSATHRLLREVSPDKVLTAEERLGQHLGLIIDELF